MVKLTYCQRDKIRGRFLVNSEILLWTFIRMASNSTFFMENLENYHRITVENGFSLLLCNEIDKI